MTEGTEGRVKKKINHSKHPRAALNPQRLPREAGRREGQLWAGSGGCRAARPVSGGGLRGTLRGHGGR